MKYVVGSLLFVIRLVPVTLLVILLLFSQLLSCLVSVCPVSYNKIVGSIPKHLYWSWVVFPICNLLLGVLGVLPIRVNYGESQKLRIRSSCVSRLTHSTEVNASEMSLSAIKSSDFIISNFTGYLQILVYAALYVFLPPLNCRASDRFGFINNQVHVAFLSDAG